MCGEGSPVFGQLTVCDAEYIDDPETDRSVGSGHAHELSLLDGV